MVSPSLPNQLEVVPTRIHQTCRRGRGFFHRREFNCPKMCAHLLASRCLPLSLFLPSKARIRATGHAIRGDDSAEPSSPRKSERVVIRNGGKYGDFRAVERHRRGRNDDDLDFVARQKPRLVSRCPIRPGRQMIIDRKVPTAVLNRRSLRAPSPSRFLDSRRQTRVGKFKSACARTRRTNRHEVERARNVISLSCLTKPRETSR